MYKAGGAKDPAQKTKKNLLINKSWSYLHDNFHKFSEDNKIKIALELAKKDLPTLIDGDMRFTEMGKITIESKPLEIKIG